MCLVLFALDAHPTQSLVVLANRDEAYARPSAPSGWWDDRPDVLAGRDLTGGGTWMGVTRTGRWTAVTNVRDPASVRDDARSRGDLTRRFLTSTAAPAAYARAVARQRGDYNGFNLVVGDPDATWFVSTREPAPRRLGAGVYGLSNDTLDTPWPKVRRGTRGLARLLEDRRFDRAAAFDLLAHAEPAPDAELPDTGVGLAWERLLSPAYIETPDYGTRTRTVLTRTHDGTVEWTERRRDGGETAVRFAVSGRVRNDEPGEHRRSPDHPGRPSKRDLP